MTKAVPVFLAVACLTSALTGCETDRPKQPAATSPVLAAAPDATLPAQAEFGTCDDYKAGSKDVPAYMRECADDADCVLESNSCCSCANGGSSVAVAQKWANCITPGECADDMACPSVYYCDDFGSECREGKCELTDLRKRPPAPSPR